MKMVSKIILWILVGLLSLGQLQRVEFQEYSISFYLHDIFIILFIFHNFFTNPITYCNAVFAFLKKEKKVLLFTGIALFSLIINSVLNTDYLALLYSARLIIYIIFGFLLFILIKNKKIDSEYFKFQLFSIGLISLVLGFLQFIFIKDTRFLSVLGWDDHYARLISTYFDPGFTGIIFLLTLLIGLSSKYLQNKIIQLLIILSFSWGIILTFSRASYISLACGLFLLALSEVKMNAIVLKRILAGVLIIITLIVIAPKPYGEGVNLLRTSTIHARTTAIQQQLSLLSIKTMLIGNGPFSEKNSLNYQSEVSSDRFETLEFSTQPINQIIPSHSRVPDNIFVTVLLSTGVFGLLLFVIQIIRWARQLQSKNIFIFTGFVCVLIHSQFSNSLLQPFVLLVLLGSIATTASTQSESKPRQNSN